MLLNMETISKKIILPKVGTIRITLPILSEESV